jgi:DNA-directed RNA polymerase specialized sigma24 family protein
MASHRNGDGRSTRSISKADLVRLLARLAADEEHAAREYERLRRTLIRFFDGRGACPPDECADQTLDRLARKLQATAVDDVWNYAHGIARLVLLERRRRPLESSIDRMDDPAMLPVPHASSDGDDDRLQKCFDRCLAELPADSRSLILRFYQGERSEKISNRRELAATLVLTENALRSRMQRLRDRLEHCVRTCFSRK